MHKVLKTKRFHFTPLVTNLQRRIFTEGQQGRMTTQRSGQRAGLFYRATGRVILQTGQRYRGNGTGDSARTGQHYRVTGRTARVRFMVDVRCSSEP